MICGELSIVENAMVEQNEAAAEEEQFEVNQTVRQQVKFAEVLVEQMNLEGSVVLLPDPDDAKWIGEDEAIVFTPDSIDSGRREVWMNEVFDFILEQIAGDVDSEFRELHEENREILYDLIAEVGRESLKAVISENSEDNETNN